MERSKTVELLEKLQKLGFNDESFWRLHHKRAKNERDTIKQHLDYCTKGQTFTGQKNKLVFDRLKFVHDTYTRVGFAPGNIGAFVALAEVAYVNIFPDEE